jgi:hypothetical protein
MSITYYVALPFMPGEDGPMPAEAKECQTEFSAIRTAEGFSKQEGFIGALAFKRSGAPNDGIFGDATVLRTFGRVPDRLDEL